MKKYQLTALISMLCLTFAANSSIELYNKEGHKISLKGRVKAMNYLTDQNNSNDGEGDKTKARIGFDGHTKITDSITGYGRAEWETKTSGTAVDTRYAYAGIRFSGFGAIDYGRNDGIVKGVISYTDVLPEFGGDAGNVNRYLLSKRTSAVLTYRNHDFFGLVDNLRWTVQYADNSSDTKVGNLKKGPEAYGMSLDYTIGDSGISLAGVYTQTANSNKFKTWATGIKYNANDLYLGALYISSKQNDSDIKYSGYEFVAQYGIKTELGQLTPSLAYIRHQDKSANVSHKNLSEYIELGATYDLNKNIKIIIDYKFNLLDKEDIGAKNIEANTKDVLALGIMYQF